MKYKTLIKLLIVFLFIFFILQFFSDLCIQMGKPTGNSQNIELLKMGLIVSPFDSEIRYLYGLALLRKNQGSLKKAIIEKSIHTLKRAIKYNILNYNAYLLLGKAYILPSIADPTIFEEAILAFKRAALIRGINKAVSLDTLKLFLSLWPLLDETDQVFCKSLLEQSINRINREEFKELIEIWTLYSRDVNFMEDVLKKNPRYYYTVADELKKKEILLKSRQSFLSLYEIYILKNTLKDYSDLPVENQELFNKLNRLKRVLSGNINGYYKLAKNTEFNEKQFKDLLVRLNREIVKIYFSKPAGQDNPFTKFEIEPVVISIIKNVLTLDELNRFDEHLNKNKFYVDRDLKRFYIKQLISFQSGQFDSVITEIEDFRKDVSYVRKENIPDFSAILLLLADSYVESRLLTRALPLLQEMVNTSSSLNEIYWRIMKIERVIGSDKEKGIETDKKEEKFREIRESRFIHLNHLKYSCTVYLVDSKEMEINISESLKEQIKTDNYHILQVFVNDLLFYETYLNNGDLGLPIKIPLPESEDVSYDGFKVEVNIGR